MAYIGSPFPTTAEAYYITRLEDQENEIEKLRQQVETIKSAKANNDKHLDHYYAEVRTLRQQRDEQAAWIEKAKAYLELCCGDLCNAEYNPCEAREILKELP